MIEIKYNKGPFRQEGRLGNKLFFHFYACVMSMVTKCRIKNPLDTCICIYDNKPQENDNLELQTYPKYTEYQEKEVVEKFIKYKDKLFFKPAERDGVFVHIRTGYGNRQDFKFLTRGGRVPDFDYYKEQIEKFSPDVDVYITADWMRAALVAKLRNAFPNLKLYQGEPEETIIFGSGFKNKILSLGTFSWWIGFLGSQNNVICPDPDKYPRWHGPIFDCMEDWKKV